MGDIYRIDLIIKKISVTAKVSPLPSFSN